MSFLIDGHNLIPQIGLRLDSLDDEMELVRLLQEFCRLTRKTVEIYFDNATPGQPATRKFGVVTGHFVQKPLIADEAIGLRLKKLGKAARNWTVVSSDHRVQAEARSSGAQVISSNAFAGTVKDRLRNIPKQPGKEVKVSSQEVDEWLEIFERRNKKF
jgi:predicted RNA-binding protein with PIN domain